MFLTFFSTRENKIKRVIIAENKLGKLGYWVTNAGNTATSHQSLLASLGCVAFSTQCLSRTFY